MTTLVKRKKVKVKSPEDLIFAVVRDMYDRLAAKAIIGIYKERDKAVREIALKYKIEL